MSEISKTSKSTNRTNTSKSGTGGSTGKKKTQQSTRNKTVSTKNSNQSNELRDEIIILVTLAVSIVLLLSNFNIAGTFGEKISYVMFGLFGIVQYIMPVVLFFLVMFILANKNNHIARIKAVAGSITVMLLCTFIQLFYSKVVPSSSSVAHIFEMSAKKRMGGGFFGSIFYKILSPFGTIASFVIVVIFIIIGIVIVTEHSFLRGIKNGSSKVYHTAKDDIEIFKEESARRQERRREEREMQTERLSERHLEKRIERKGNKQTVEMFVDGEEVHEPRVEKKKRGVTTNTKLTDFDETLVDDFGVEIVTPTENSEKAPELKEIFIPMKEEDVHTVSTKEKDVEIAQTFVPEKKTKKTEQEKAAEVADIAQQINKENENKEDRYVFPPVSLLAKNSQGRTVNGDVELKATAMKLTQILQNFGVKATVTNATKGPTVTRYELTPEQGVKVSKIVSLSDDIKLNLAATDIRIEAPIPGKAAVGIEVPNREKSNVMFRDIIESAEFKSHGSNICFGVGKDIGGNVVVADLAKMPHLLIAGSTGSGKSVCINTIIMSLLYKADPNDVKLIMIDPKVVELKIYNDIPHLLIPVVTDCKKAAGALNWAVAEMDKRYKLFADYNVRDLKGYNEKIKTIEHIEDENKPQKMPQIVIVVDEVAELMMVAQNEVENAIVRLAQLARAAGIHLVIATQRPTVNVITGLIKANVPSKIAFAVSSGIDSRTIIDRNGAEKLLGRGDMLYFPSEYPNPVRLQGAFISDKEVSDVVEFVKNNTKPVSYNETVSAHIETPGMNESQAFGGERDSYFAEAGRFVIEREKASIGMIQRMYKVGFNRAARIMDQLTDAGVVGPEEGTKPRKILMTLEEFEQIL